MTTYALDTIFSVITQSLKFFSMHKLLHKCHFKKANQAHFTGEKSGYWRANKDSSYSLNVKILTSVVEYKSIKLEFETESW